MPDAQDPAEPETTTTVLLRHHTPDGSAHLDWMIELPARFAPPQIEHRLNTFRCEADPILSLRVDSASPPWTGRRLPDHRVHYLTHQGPIGGNRGWVERLWSRPCRVTGLSSDARTIEIMGAGHSPMQLLLLHRTSGDMWGLRSVQQTDIPKN